MHRLLIIFSICLLTALTSCHLLDNEQPIPAFLELNNPVVKLPDFSGNDSHKITDVWVFEDGQILGVFPLPAKVPITVTGKESEITILAGIRNNGMNDTPVFYPFYKSIVKKVQATANELITIPLEFEYISNAKIPINESFETGNSFWLDLDNNPDTKIKVSNDTFSLGSKSGLVLLSSSLKFMEVGCNTAIKKGENARGQSYLELDYTGVGEIAIGIAKTRGITFIVEYVLFVPCRDNWNKIYVDLTDKLSQNDYDEYRIVLGFTKTGLGQYSNIYIDNIKHVHF